MTLTYTPAEMDEAIARFETAKQNNPRGWNCLAAVGLSPPDAFVRYAFMNADAHLPVLGRGEDLRVIYSAAWLNGLGVGASLRWRP